MWHSTYASVTVAHKVVRLCIDSGTVCGTVPMHRLRYSMWYSAYVSIVVPYVALYLYIGGGAVCGIVLVHQ